MWFMRGGLVICKGWLLFLFILRWIYCVCIGKEGRCDNEKGKFLIWVGIKYE